MSLLLAVLLAPAVAGPPPVTVERGALVVTTDKGPLRIVPAYHATTRVELGGQVVWLDPWSKAKLDGAPKADVVLITDTHFDHLDRAALAKVTQTSTVIVAPPAVAAEAKDLVVQHVVRNGGSVVLGDLTVRAVPMYNLERGPEPGRRFHDPGRGNGYVLTYGGVSVYFAGDTECVPEVKALRGIDVAFLPMNLPYTMPVDEAAACVAAFRPAVVVPYHYAGSDLAAFRAAAAPSGVRVETLEFYPGGLPW